MFRYMDEDDIESITKEIAKLGPISPKIREEVVEEFYQMVLAQEYVSTGGADYAEENLDEEIGDLKATLFLDFCLREIGPSVYNQAIADAQIYLQERLIDLDGVCKQLEFGYWPKEQEPGK